MFDRVDAAYRVVLGTALAAGAVESDDLVAEDEVTRQARWHGHDPCEVVA